MWRPRRRRESPAADAIADLIEAGIVEIRAIAYRREGLRTDAFPQADLPGTDPPHRRCARHSDPRAEAGISDTPTWALQYTWDSRTDEQRRWLRHTFETCGRDIADLITTRTANPNP